MATWSDLLPEILNEISAKLDFYEDFINFHCVCSSWRSSASTTTNFIQRPLLPSRFPMLMLAESSKIEAEEEDDEDDDQQDCRSFFLLSSRMVRKVELPEARWKLCISAQGWLLTTGEAEFSAKLLHPISRTQIDLPKLYMFDELYFDDQHEWMYYGHCMRRVVFTSPNPLLKDPSFRAIIIWGETIGFCRPGDGSWSRLSGWDGNLFDITYHNIQKHLYVMDTLGSIYKCDILNKPDSSNLCRLTTFPGKEMGCLSLPAAYLLEWDRDSLLMVTRERKYYKKQDDEHGCYGPYSTKAFRCFLFNLDDGKWSKIATLGDKSVFLGYNSSFAIKAGGGMNPDCIYFTDDHYEPYLDLPNGGGGDVGVYRMFDGSIQTMFDSQESIFRGSPPLWLQASPLPATTCSSIKHRQHRQHQYITPSHFKCPNLNL